MRLACMLVMSAVLGPDDGCLALFEGSPPEDGDRRAAHGLWVRECADCHGVVGGVDGSLSAGLDPQPPDFSDPCRSITDEWIARVILDGGATFNGSAAMRSHHELREHPKTLVALVELVQGFRGVGPCKSHERPPQVDPHDAD